MSRPSSIALAERQKLSKSTCTFIDSVAILARVPPTYPTYNHSEAPSTQIPAVIMTPSQMLAPPALRKPGSPPATKPSHNVHHTRLLAVSISARVWRGDFRAREVDFAMLVRLASIRDARRGKADKRSPAKPGPAERGGFEPPTPGLPT